MEEERDRGRGKGGTTWHCGGGDTIEGVTDSFEYVPWYHFVDIAYVLYIQASGHIQPTNQPISYHSERIDTKRGRKRKKAWVRDKWGEEEKGILIRLHVYDVNDWPHCNRGFFVHTCNEGLNPVDIRFTMCIQEDKYILGVN